MTLQSWWSPTQVRASPLLSCSQSAPTWSRLVELKKHVVAKYIVIVVIVLVIVKLVIHANHHHKQKDRHVFSVKKMSDLRELPELPFIPIIITLTIKSNKNMIWLIRNREWCARATWAAPTLKASTWTAWGTQWITASISTQIQIQMILAEMRYK